MKKISPKKVLLVKRMLPYIREEVKGDLGKWEYLPEEEFNSDEKVIALLPFASYEYLLMNRNLRADRMTIIEWLNMGLFDDSLDKIVAHSLRKLALKVKFHKIDLPEKRISLHEK